MSIQPNQDPVADFMFMTQRPRDAFTPGVLLHQQVLNCDLTDSELRIAAHGCLDHLTLEIRKYAAAATNEIAQLKALAQQDQGAAATYDGMSTTQLKKAISVMIERRWVIEERARYQGLPSGPEHLWEGDQVARNIPQLLDSYYHSYVSCGAVVDESFWGKWWSGCKKLWARVWTCGDHDGQVALP